MSSFSANMTTLPWLPRRQVIENLLDDLAFAKVVVLRAVCGWFNHKILDAIMARQLICVREGYGYDNGGFRFQIPRPIMAKLLLHRLRSAPCDDAQHLHAIDGFAKIVQQLCELQFKMSEEAITEGLLARTVSHLGPDTVVKMMITESCVYDYPSNDSCNILAAAAFCGQLNFVESLVRKGVCAGTKSTYFGFPLTAAAEQGHIKVVRFLLEHDVRDSSSRAKNFEDPRNQDNLLQEESALEAASRRGNYKITKLLLEPTYQYDTAGDSYNNAIMGAVQCGHSDLAMYLLLRSTYTEHEGLRVAIFLKACINSNLQVVRTMLANGVDVHSGAACNERLILVRPTLGRQIQLERQLPRRVAVAEFDQSDTYICAFNLAAKNGNVEVVKILLDNGGNVNAGSGFGLDNPLRQAAYHEQLEMVQLLLDRGADIGFKGCGQDALDDAIMTGSEGLIRILVEAGVAVDGRKYDFAFPRPSPMLLAYMYGQHRAAKLLLNLGAQEVDPLKTEWAIWFQDGTYPKDISLPTPVLKG